MTHFRLLCERDFLQLFPTFASSESYSNVSTTIVQIEVEPNILRQVIPEFKIDVILAVTYVCATPKVSMSEICRIHPSTRRSDDHRSVLLSFSPSNNLTEDVVGERSHDFSVVRLDNSGKSRDRSRDGGFAEESEKTKHSKTSVVDFLLESSSLLFITGLLGESSRVEEVQWDRVGKVDNIEVREVTRLSSSHVVLVVVSANLGPGFQEKDESEDLPLGVIRDSIPDSRGVVALREGSSVHHHRPWEFDSVGVDDVSDESEHSNTSVPIID